MTSNTAVGAQVSLWLIADVKPRCARELCRCPPPFCCQWVIVGFLLVLRVYVI